MHDGSGAAADRSQRDSAFLHGVGLSKSYGPVKALSPTTFALSPGEVVGLIGHNGAGKSTLINLLAGVVARSAGTLACLGVPVAGWTSAAARDAGLRVVFQELSLCPNLTAVENTRLLHRSLSGWTWRARAEQAITAALDTVFPGHGIPRGVPVGALSIGQRQMVEIARAFSETDAPIRAVILDEPTSSLGPEPTQQLLDHLRRATARGIACLFVTHRLNEILAVADRVVTMKDGQVVADQPNRGLDRAQLVQGMGSAVALRAARQTGDPAAPALFTYPGKDAEDRAIALAPGRIVGLAGLDGHGQRNRLRAVHASAEAAGIPVAFVAGDRVVEGVFPLWSIRDNLTVRSLGALSDRGLVRHSASSALATTWFDRLKIRAPGIHVPLVSLSGGNQQKVLLARALASDARLVVLDDPLRGVDIGTKQEVYALIRAEAEGGRAFLWYSTEIEELENCDAVFVFREGRAVARLDGDRIEERHILQASFGGGHG